MKASLEDAARDTNRSVARLLDEIVAERLDATGQRSAAEMDNQRRLHSRAARFLGCIAGRDTRRSERTRELVRAQLKRRHARAR